ncbi:MAG: hypothetical protein JSU72_20180 [Deltaproteobacteria bacterium]|nr:MAG: hypothetical protein JSU72_20180 [Deltaproteobacteria bacterium]
MTRVLFVLVIAALVALVGCKASSGTSDAGRVATELAPNIDDYHVETVASLGFVNKTGDPEADEMATTMIQALYQAGIYHFVLKDDFERDAERVGVGEDFDRLVRVWQKKLTVDENVVERVLAATDYDALIGMEITKWEEVKLQPNQEGTSDTSVGVHLHLYGQDGTLLWSASDLKTEQSVAYLPSFNTRATGSGEAITTSADAVPDPPPIRKVATEIAQTIASTMPVIKKAESDTN